MLSLPLARLLVAISAIAPATAALRLSAHHLSTPRLSASAAPYLLASSRLGGGGVRLAGEDELLLAGEDKKLLAGEEELLLNALGRVGAARGGVVVVKYGGHAMTNDARAAEFAADMAVLQSIGMRPVVVHGGGPQIGAMLERLQIHSEFVDGLRVTDAATMEVVEMVLCGVLNKKIAASINAAGGRAVGLSGKDDSLVVASKKGHSMVDAQSGKLVEVDLGLVGAPHTVRTPLLEQLLDGGIIPVIAPVATGEGGASYNVNADTMAGVVASALKASTLLLLTDVPGVLDGQKQLIRSLSTAEAQKLCDDGTASGGMIPKLGTAIDAVTGGVGSAVIMDGRVSHCSLLHLFGKKAVGTSIS